MAEPQQTESSQPQPNPASTNANFDVGGNVGGNVTVGNNNTVVNNYYPVVENNIEKHEPDYWALKHPYPMPPNFTGRIPERALLTHWLKEDSENRLLILRALGGFGKSALAWHWLTHDVDIQEYPKVVFWSFYEGDASFEHFIEETLKYLKLEVPQGIRPQVDVLLKAMQFQKILLIMDGFERTLRFYASMNAAYQDDEAQQVEERQLDSKNMHADWFLKCICSSPNITSKILIATRYLPNAVTQRGELLLGCWEKELSAMEKVDAVEFFHKQNINGLRTEIETVCADYGYHPLSLRILVGLIINDRENPRDIAVANKFDITDDIVANKEHVLKIAYDTLSFGQQKLLSNMACSRSSVSYQMLKYITSKPSWRRKNKRQLNEKLDDSLKALEIRGLISWDYQSNKYDLHPIVRRFAYKRLTAPERIGAHNRLIDYFEAIPNPEKVEKIEDLAPVIELYNHTIRAEQYDKAMSLYYRSLKDVIYYQFGNYTLAIELVGVLVPHEQDNLLKLEVDANKAWALNHMANAYSLSGQSHRAVPLIEAQNALQEKANDKKNLARGLGNLAEDQLKIGALKEAERNLRRRIDLCSEVKDEAEEAIGHQSLGRVLSYRGMWQEAEDELLKSQKVFDEIGIERTNFGSVNWAYRSLYRLLLSRLENPNNVNLSIEYAHQALKLAEEHSTKRVPYPRDYVRAYWLLGAACRINNEFDKAEENLSKAIGMCRQINLVEVEADILLELARLRYDQKYYEEAKSLAEEALTITERCGYVLQGADVNLFLAQYALEQEQNKVKAKQYAEEAKKLATCDGPPYYYKVAYEEAERFLENLK